MNDNILTLVDPTTVIIDPNVRDSAEVTTEFVANIKEHGVLVPALGYTDPDGVVHITAGQRRTLAAREAGVQLPVVLGAATTKADSISRQIVENDQRESLTTHQRVAAYSQLALEGISVTKIAKALSIPKKHVEAALTVAKAPATLEALEEGGDIDLVTLAAITEFEGDTDWHETLLETALNEPSRFDNMLEQAARARRRRERLQAHVDELNNTGIAATTADALRAEGIEFAKVAELHRDEAISPTIEGEPEIRTVVSMAYWRDDIDELQVMVNPTAYGYTTKKGMTDEEKDARRRLIARNKEWDASEAVRVRWLTSFLQRKQFPKDAAPFIATSLAQFSRYLGEQDDKLAYELLGLERSYRENAIVNLLADQPAKAGQATLALILGEFETGTSRNTWRYPDAKGKHYLQQLEAWGYQLTPVEKLAAGYEVSDDEFDRVQAPIEDDDIEADVA